MAFTTPYEQLNYMGEHANDASATTEVQANDWDTNGDGTGTPQPGMFYYNTGSKVFLLWDGTQWAAISGTSDHNSLSGIQGGLASIGGDEYYHLDQSDYDTLRGGAADASSLHHHDSLYFRETEFINSTAGVADAGKPIVLDAAGLLDSTFIDVGSISHAGLANLVAPADDHTQYALLAGRTGGQSLYGGDGSGDNLVLYSTSHATPGQVDVMDELDMNTNKIVNVVDPFDPQDAATKAYVDQRIQGLDWQESVLTQSLSTPPVAPADNARYIVAAGGTGAWSGKDEQIAEWIPASIGGSGWEFTIPDEGTATWVEDVNIAYVYNDAYPAGTWVKLASIVNHNDLAGIQGGQASEYYHMTSAEHIAITGSGGVVNASAYHIHDDRYFTETELGSIVGGSEGASLIGTDSKTRLNAATTVEVALTEINAAFPKVLTAAGTNPNGVTTPTLIGDLYVSTTSPFRRYIAVGLTNADWRVL